VAQRVRMNPVLKASPLGSLLAGIPRYFGGDGTISCVPAPARE
jgi:hypothetical protein